jgi:hypothetical protein
VEGLGVDGSIKLKCVLKKYDGGREHDVFGLGQCQLYEHRREPSCFLITWLTLLQAERLLASPG